MDENHRECINIKKEHNHGTDYIKDNFPALFDNYVEHEIITTEMSRIYRAKNADYGDSFHKSFEKFGAISAIVRMDDKLSRAYQLLTQNVERKVKDETIEDTLIDLANYAIMTVIELRRKKV